MDKNLSSSREHFIQGVSRIAYFWGFPKAMGAIYGAIYLSPTPLTLDVLVDQVSISKGAVSTNVRILERLGMIHKQFKVGDRKDYYFAEEDFWKIVKGILREREKNEFNLAISSVGESLEMIQNTKPDPQDAELANFYKIRMKGMKKFFDVLDKLVVIAITLDDLNLGTIKNFFGKLKNNPV